MRAAGAAPTSVNIAAANITFFIAGLN
jgi:hypothetical protein